MERVATVAGNREQRLVVRAPHLPRGLDLHGMPASRRSDF